jgi:hypothetical protein
MLPETVHDLGRRMVGSIPFALSISESPRCGIFEIAGFCFESVELTSLRGALAFCESHRVFCSSYTIFERDPASTLIPA